MQWELLAALLPDGVELNPSDDNSAEITSKDSSVTVVANNDNSFVVGQQTIHFEDDNPEIINTILVPCILQQLDGQRRI